MRSTIAFARAATSIALPLVVTIFLTIGSAGCGDGEQSTAPSPEEATKPHIKTHASQPLINKSDSQVSSARPGQLQQAQIRNHSSVRTERSQPRSRVPGLSDQTAKQFNQELITALTDLGVVMVNNAGDVISIQEGLDVSDAGLALLAGCSMLESLNLSDSRVTDNGLKSLAHLEQLKWLDLSQTAITDRGLQHLSQLSNLEELILRRTKVTATGMRHLKDLDNLRVLILSDTQVADDGLQHLSELSQIDVLGLYGSKITDDGLGHIAETTRAFPIPAFRPPPEMRSSPRTAGQTPCAVS